MKVIEQKFRIISVLQKIYTVDFFLKKFDSLPKTVVPIDKVNIL